MRRLVLLFVLLVAAERIFAQTSVYVPFAEAERAIAFVENRPKIIDSLKHIYAKRWTIGAMYGQRFITKANVANDSDTITLSDFTDERSFFGLEGGYFITKNIQVLLAMDILPLPKKQEITSLSFGGPNGIAAEGRGSGGAMVNVGIGGKYFFNVAPYTRIYSGLKLGAIRAVAVGGEGGFTSGQGQFQETTRLIRNYNYGNVLFGFTHRLSPCFVVDFSMGYLHATSSRNIGGIVSPGGITSTLTFQFIIGKGNRVR